MKLITIFVSIIIVSIASTANLKPEFNLQNESLKANKDFKQANDINLGLNTVNTIISADLFSNSYMMLMTVFALSSIIFIVALLPILSQSQLSYSG